jgi:hypothetical protein
MEKELAAKNAELKKLEQENNFLIQDDRECALSTSLASRVVWVLI